MPSPQTAEPTLLTPSRVLAGESPLALIAYLEPVAHIDRFQPAGFPEIGHVFYKAPRTDGSEENVCLVDSSASMANHLESVCLRGAHDPALVPDLDGMPYVRCVTGEPDRGKVAEPEVVVTSLTEGHRMASTYFLQGKRLVDGMPETEDFAQQLARWFGVVLPGSKKAHVPPGNWWKVFRTIFQYDPNSLVHGILFPQWQIKVSRVLTAHLEAFGASRVDRSGVKFDRLGRTTSGQPVFAVDDALAREIRATFILDIDLVRSFGRTEEGRTLGLTEKQKEFLLALALWKVDRLLAKPFRFRSGCHLRCLALLQPAEDRSAAPIQLDVDIRRAIREAEFTTEPRITDLYWPSSELYREADRLGPPTNRQQDEDGEEPEGE